MDAGTRELVHQRAGNRCEYCLLQQWQSGSRHQIEHIVARQHGGRDIPDNLALACDRCNLRKGPNLSGIDPVSGVLAALFHPRRDVWAEHFRFSRRLHRRDHPRRAANRPGARHERHPPPAVAICDPGRTEVSWSDGSGARWRDESRHGTQECVRYIIAVGGAGSSGLPALRSGICTI